MDRRMSVDAGDLLYERGSGSNGDQVKNEEALRWIQEAKARQEEAYSVPRSDAMNQDSTLNRFCRKSALLGFNPFFKSPKKGR